MMSAMGITMAMSGYQEIMLVIGISGCGLESISQEECESNEFLFIMVPLLFRQVILGCTLVNPVELCSSSLSMSARTMPVSRVGVPDADLPSDLLLLQLLCYCALTYILFSQLSAIRICRRMVIPRAAEDRDRSAPFPR